MPPAKVQVNLHPAVERRVRVKLTSSPSTAAALLGVSRPLPRIAMVSTSGYLAANPRLGAPDTGGQSVYVVELSKRLALLGYQVDIWTRRFDDQAEIERVGERVRIVRVPCGGPGFIAKDFLCEHLAEWNEHALRLIHQHRLEYAFINSHHWDAGLAAQHLATTLGVAHVHTPHSLGTSAKQEMQADPRCDHEQLEARFNFTRRINEERRVYEDCDLIVATTPQQFDALTSDYEMPARKLRMIPAGYDDHRFFPVSDAARAAIRRRLDYHGKVVLAMGRLARDRGYDLLIRAFPLVAARDPDTVLHLRVGGRNATPEERRILAELKTLARKSGCHERIRLGPFIAGRDLADHYRAADMFVLCSRYEPFGLTAIEAMACGTPTVLTVHGGLYRALSFGRHALFADPLDREDLGITIAKIFRHPRLRERLSRMGAHKARSLFTWTGIAQQLVAAIEQRSRAEVTLDETESGEAEP